MQPQRSAARSPLTRLGQRARDVDGAGADGRDGEALLFQLCRVLRHDHVLRALRHAVRSGLVVPPLPHDVAHASAGAYDDDLLRGALPEEGEEGFDGVDGAERVHFELWEQVE